MWCAASRLCRTRSLALPGAAAAAIAVGLAACALPVPETDRLSTQPVSSSDETAAVEALRQDLPGDGTEPLRIPPPDPRVGLPKAGDDVVYGIVATPELEAVWQAQYDKDWRLSERLMDKLDQDFADQPKAAYWVGQLRIQTLIHAGQSEAAIAFLDELERREIAAFGNNIETLSQRGQIAFWQGRADEAIAYYTRVLAAMGDWALPTFFLLPPSNIDELVHMGSAQVRTYIGLAGAHISIGDYKRGYAWAELSRKRARAIIDISEHMIYGRFVETAAHMYEAMAWSLLFLAGARVGYSDDITASEHVFDAAVAHFRQAAYVDAELLAQSVRGFVTQTKGLVPHPTVRIGLLPEPPSRADGELRSLLRSRPEQLGAHEDISLPLPSADTVRLPGVGEQSAYEVVVTRALSAAFDAYLKGDGETALAEIERTEADATVAVGARQQALYAWYLSYLRSQVFIMMGRAADAEVELVRTAEREQRAFGSNLNSRALRGEARMWLGDLDAAIDDFAQVIEALGTWREPTIFVFPPLDIPQLIAMTRAHFRSYLGIAGALMLKRDYAVALPWAEEAENLFEEAFYVAHHPLYGNYIKIDADLYYGRGINLGILGAARLAVTRDVTGSDAYFDAANAYFDALGYAAGRATVEAFRVRALIDIDRADLAEPYARDAADLASEKGLADLVWQLEALRAEVLPRLGRTAEAEGAWRRAEAAVDVVSGALASDTAKRRFGVGKEGITRALIEIDVAKRDHATLFRDMERGRARSLVDMLAERPVAEGREVELVAAIRALDRQIRRQRLLNAAPGGASEKGLAHEAELLDARRERVRALRTRDPELAEVMSIATQQLSDVQQRLGPREVMAYALPAPRDEDAPFRFLLIDREQSRVETTSLTEYDLSILLYWFAEADPLAVAAEQAEAAETLATALGVGAWGGDRLLYVVPSGNLYFVPWGALGLDYAVVVLPTGGWLNRSPKSADFKRRAAVVGDPELGHVLPALPGARIEAMTVGKEYGVDALLGEAATEAALRRTVGTGVEVLHLATHGTFDAAEPLSSAVYLSTGDGAVALTAAQLFERPLSAKLVVLSACETGLGEAVAGDDFLGLARSFYLGGALSVVNSLWPVHDEPTRRFMEEFHRDAREGAYGEAWVRARDSLRAHGYPPSIYGAFVLGGAWATRPPTDAG